VIARLEQRFGAATRKNLVRIENWIATVAR
jgi:hypothetical protein